MRHIIAFIVCAMQVTLLLSCGSSTVTDQQRLRKHFNIAPNIEILEFSAYPPSDNWTREGLKIQATFQLSKKEIDAIVKEGHKLGWRNLPIPDETMAKLPFINSGDQIQINIPFDAEGLFLCKTAGDNVLYASATETSLCENQIGTLHCTEAMSLEEAKNSNKCKRRFGDQILGVLEFNSQKLYVFIGSTY